MQGDRSVGRMMRHRRGDASSFLTPPMTPPSPFNPAFVTMKFQAIWDGNGKIDLVYNLAGTGEIYLLRNVGVEDGLPVFAPPRQFCCYGRPIAFTVHGPNCWPGDVNGDGHPDLMGCTEWSVYPIYSHAALEMASHPTYTIEECY